MNAYVEGTEPRSVVVRLADILDRIRALEDEAAICKAWLARALGEGSHRFGPVTCSISHQRRFSTAQAAHVLPADWLTQVMRPAIDTKVAKDVLPPELYRACQTQLPNPTVRLT